MHRLGDIFQDGRWLSKFKLNGKTRSTDMGSIWNNTQARTREGGKYQSQHPTYVGCTNDFADFREFAEWCTKTFGYTNRTANNKYWELDKDIIVPGNKSYSTKTCCFVPYYINGLLKTNTGNRGKYPIGVHETENGRFMAQASFNKKQVYLGIFGTPVEAHRAWQVKKVEAIKHAIAECSDFPKPILKGLRRRAREIQADFKAGVETC